MPKCKNKTSLSMTKNGRKYKLALIMMIAMLAAFALSALNSMLAGIYSEFLTGLGMIYITYCGGNVGKEWVVGKKNGFQAKANQQSSIQHAPPPANGEI